MTGTINFLIWGKETGRSGRIWRNQAWSGTGSSGGSFAKPLLFDTLKKGCSSPEMELDVGDFPWSPKPKLLKQPSTTSLTNQIHKSLLEFDEMLDGLEADEDEERTLFTQPPTSLNPSKTLCSALTRSASKNLFTRRSSSGSGKNNSNENHEGIYECIDDKTNIESGYTTAEQESNASNSITSASSGLSGMADKRRQPYGQISTNFDDVPFEDSDFGDQFVAPPLPVYQSDEDGNDFQDSEGTATRESSFDYEAIMRKKRPKMGFKDEGLGLTDDELQRLNVLLSDDEKQPNSISSNNIDNNSSILQDESSSTFVYETNENNLESSTRSISNSYGHHGDDFTNYQEFDEVVDGNADNEFNDDNSSHFSNPSTLTSHPPIHLNIPPPPDFIPPPPPIFFPPPPELFLEDDERGENDTLKSSDGMDHFENYTIDFEEEPANAFTNNDEFNDDNRFSNQESPDDFNPDNYDSFIPESPMSTISNEFHDVSEDTGVSFPAPPPAPPPPPIDWLPPKSPKPFNDQVQPPAPFAPPLQPHDEFPWTEGEDPEEENESGSFPFPPLAPPPPPCDWLPPSPSQPLATHISALKESLGNVKLKKVRDSDQSPRSPLNNGVADAVGAIASMILSGAFKLKPSANGVAIRNECDLKNGKLTKNADHRYQPDVTASETTNDDEEIYLNSSEFTNAPNSPEANSQNQNHHSSSSPNFEKSFDNQKIKNPINSSKLLKSSHNENSDIDVTQIPGYQVVPESAAPWKKDLIVRKNQQLLEKFMAEKDDRKVKDGKWKDVPDWKRQLLLEKEKKKSENPVTSMFKAKPVVLKKSEAVIQWKQRVEAQNI